MDVACVSPRPVSRRAGGPERESPSARQTCVPGTYRRVFFVSIIFACCLSATRALLNVHICHNVTRMSRLTGRLPRGTRKCFMLIQKKVLAINGQKLHFCTRRHGSSVGRRNKTSGQKSRKTPRQLNNNFFPTVSCLVSL